MNILDSPGFTFFIGNMKLLEILLDHVRLIETGTNYKIKIPRSDNGTEFKNSVMEEFCKLKGISHQFSAPGTPQQNGVSREKK